MIAKVIVDIPSKSVDFKFDYIVPQRLEDGIQIGVRVIVPFGPRQFKVMSWTFKMNQIKVLKSQNLKEIKEFRTFSLNLQLN